MPVVNRQTATDVKVVKRGGSILDRIVDVGVRTKLDRFLIYGESGSGKTRLACSWPKPLLLIAAEDGTESVRNVKGVRVARLERASEINDLIRDAQDSKWKTVVIDTATSFYGMVLAEVMGVESIPSTKPSAAARKNEYIDTAYHAKQYLHSLLRLAEYKLANVVILGQEKPLKTKDDGFDPEFVKPRIMVALSDAVRDFVNAECDYIIHTEVQNKYRITSEVIDGEKIEMREPLKGVIFCARVQTHPTFLVKFRVPEGVKLPEFVDLTDRTDGYAQLRVLIDGGGGKK